MTDSKKGYQEIIDVLRQNGIVYADNTVSTMFQGNGSYEEIIKICNEYKEENE